MKDLDAILDEHLQKAEAADARRAKAQHDPDGFLDDALHEQAVKDAKREGRPAPLHPNEITKLTKEHAAMKRALGVDNDDELAEVIDAFSDETTDPETTDIED